MAAWQCGQRFVTFFLIVLKVSASAPLAMPFFFLTAFLGSWNSSHVKSSCHSTRQLKQLFEPQCPQHVLGFSTAVAS